MKIKEVCCCGAMFEATDDKNVLIATTAEEDKNGDTYVIERHLREFRRLHKPCLKKVMIKSK